MPGIHPKYRFGLLIAVCVACGGDSAGEAGAPEEAPAPPTVTAEPGAAFELAHGSAASIGDGGLRIAFRRLAEESRCPAGVQCPTAGNAAVELAAETGSGAAATVLLNTGRPPREAPIHGWTVRLEGLAPPAPDPGAPVDTAAYVATLVAERAE